MASRRFFSAPPKNPAKPANRLRARIPNGSLSEPSRSSGRGRAGWGLKEDDGLGIGEIEHIDVFENSGTPKSSILMNFQL